MSPEFTELSLSKYVWTKVVKLNENDLIQQQQQQQTNNKTATMMMMMTMLQLGFFHW